MIPEDDEDQPKPAQINVKMSSALKAEYERLGSERQRGKLIRAAIRSLSLGQTSEANSPASHGRDFSKREVELLHRIREIGLEDIFPNYLTHDFSEFLGADERLDIHVGQLGLFLALPGHRDALIERIFTSHFHTRILIQTFPTHNENGEVTYDVSHYDEAALKDLSRMADASVERSKRGRLIVGLCRAPAPVPKFSLVGVDAAIAVPDLPSVLADPDNPDPQPENGSSYAIMWRNVQGVGFTHYFDLACNIHNAIEDSNVVIDNMSEPSLRLSHARNKPR